MAYADSILGFGCTDIEALNLASDVTLSPRTAGVRVGVAGNVIVRGPSSAADVTIPANAGEMLIIGNGVIIRSTSTATGLIRFGN